MAGQEGSQLWFLRIKDLSYPTLRPHSDWETQAGFSPCGVSPACQDEQASMFSPALQAFIRGRSLLRAASKSRSAAAGKFCLHRRG